MITSWEHAGCPLSGIKRPLVGGRFTTSSILNSIGAITSARYMEVVHWREGPLCEVPLYSDVSAALALDSAVDWVLKTITHPITGGTHFNIIANRRASKTKTVGT